MTKRWFFIFFTFLFSSFLLPQSLSAQKRINCDLCRQKISGQYMKYETDHKNSLVCLSCKNTKPSCTICRIPHNRHNLTLYRGRELWCSDCVKRTDSCELCKNPISGKFFTLNFSDGKWCQQCMNSHEECYFCQEPFDRPGYTLEPGITSCTKCNEFALNGQYAYEQLAAKIHPQMEELLGKKFKIVPIRTVTPSEMAYYTSGFTSEAIASSKENGYLDPIEAPAIPSSIQTNLGLFTRKGIKREILVLNGLPEDLAWEVISHEMTHAWQDEHHSGIRDFYLVEGFAQLVAQKICYKNHRRQRLNLLYFRSDDYGHAYRIVQTLEDREGFQAVMNSVDRGSLPKDYQTTPTKEIFSVEF